MLKTVCRAARVATGRPARSLVEIIQIKDCGDSDKAGNREEDEK